VDRRTGIFADGIGAAAATSGILTQLLAVDAGLGAFSRGQPMAPEAMRDSVVSRIPIEEGSRPDGG
jgi:hypothetical protein